MMGSIPEGEAVKFSAVGVGFSLVVYNLSFRLFRETQKCIIRQLVFDPDLILPSRYPSPSTSYWNVAPSPEHMIQVVDHCLS